MVGVVQSKVTGNASTPRRMASVFTQIDEIESTNNGAGAGFIEQDLLDLGETCYNNGSDPTVLMIPPAVAQTVAGFAAASGRTRDFGQSREIVNAIDLIVSPYGEYRVVLNRHINADMGLLMDPTMFKTVTLRPFTRTLLAKTGDSDRHMITGEVSVKHNVFADSGQFNGFVNAVGGAG